jgi:benzylsuccinate CoA-transferase BbsF subunit
MKELLEGIRVVDMTVYVTGPLTTRTLADCGAEVIKIDTQVRLGRGGTGFNQHSTSKLSVTLNFSSPKGLELAHKLIAQADIVVENHAAGTLARKGLAYEDIKKIKPDIIMLSSCMHGQTGPYADHAAFGHQLTALSGFNQISGWPDREPGWLGPYTDVIAPRYNIIAILAALDYRRRTGKGQFLDMAQNEGGMQFLAPVILDYTANDQVAGREGNHSSYAAPHNAYRCQGEDIWCAISVFSDEEWLSFCRVIGNPGLAEDLRFANLQLRKENEDELDRLVNDWTENHTAEEVMKMMQAAGVAAGAAEICEVEMDNNPQLKERNFLLEFEHPDIGKYRTPNGAHFLLSKSTWQPRRAPTVGEHNDYVFREIVGLSDDEMNELINEGVIN